MSDLPYPDRPPGDPDGRRLARQTALRLSEAGRMARALEALMARAGLDAEPAVAISKLIASQETAHLMRAEGKVLSRKRFRHKSGSPLHEDRIRNLIYIDESGRSEPRFEAGTFALGGVAMSPASAEVYVEEANALKLDFFGRTDITFHEPSMRHHLGWFEFKHNAEKQAKFCLALEELIEKIPLTAFGVVIRKSDFHRFLNQGSDPYLPPDTYATAIHMMMERYVDYLATSTPHDPMGQVTFESQGPKEDAEHSAHFVELLLGGTQWVPESAFRNWLEPGVRFVRKQGSHPTELADMLSRDLFEWGQGGFQDGPRRLAVWNRKVYRRDDMRMGRFGVKVFPDSDIKTLIDAHRALCAGN